MTHTFEIKVQCKGNAAGTLNWLNSFLADGELVIKNTKTGGVGMFFHSNTKPDGSIANENECNKFICKAVSNTYDYQEYRYSAIGNDNYVVFVYVQNDEYGMNNGLFNFPLTPAASEKMEEFIDSAVEEYTSWWKEQ